MVFMRGMLLQGMEYSLFCRAVNIHLIIMLSDRNLHRHREKIPLQILEMLDN